VIRDELVSEHSKPPVQVASLVARSDGSLVAVYGDSLGLRSRVRNPEGGWEPEGMVEVADGALASGVMTVGLADDVIHMAYTATAPDGGARSVRHRTLTPSGSLTAATRLGEGVGTAEEDIGALLPLEWESTQNTVVVAWRRADGALWERRIRANGSVSAPVQITSRPVVQSGADSDQVGADLVVHDGAVHVVFIDGETRDLWHTSSPAPGDWTPARPVVEGIWKVAASEQPIVYGCHLMGATFAFADLCGGLSRIGLARPRMGRLPYRYRCQEKLFHWCHPFASTHC
jgi:hypothetical protein